MGIESDSFSEVIRSTFSSISNHIYFYCNVTKNKKLFKIKLTFKSLP